MLIRFVPGLLLVVACGKGAPAPAAPGEGSATATTTATCDVITREADLAGCIGSTVTLQGLVSQTKIPTILGVDVDAELVPAGGHGWAKGKLTSYTIEPQAPDEPIVASRGPGTYLALEALDGSGLAKATLLLE